MRVLHVYKTYFPEDGTGVPQVIKTLAEGTHSHGVTSEVLALYRQPSKVPEFVGHHRVHAARQELHFASTSLSISAIRRFASLVPNFDIIHYHFPWPMADLLHLFHGRSKPSIVTYHSDIVKQRRLLAFYRPLMQRFLSDVDVIVATSPNYVDSSPVLQKLRAKTTVIPIGLPDRSPPDPNLVSKWRGRVGEDFFLFIGAFRYYKGLHDLIAAARLSNLPVVLVGNNDAKVVDTGALPPNVICLGQVSDPDKEALLESCVAKILPSHLRSEAFGVSLVEAARAARPMITCDIETGTTFVNLHGNTGIVIPPGDPYALAQAMRELTSNREYARQLGEQARARYVAMFQADQMVQSYVEQYHLLRDRCATR